MTAANPWDTPPATSFVLDEQIVALRAALREPLLFTLMLDALARDVVRAMHGRSGGFVVTDVNRTEVAAVMMCLSAILAGLNHQMADRMPATDVTNIVGLIGLHLHDGDVR